MYFSNADPLHVTIHTAVDMVAMADLDRQIHFIPMTERKKEERNLKNENKRERRELNRKKGTITYL